MQTLITIIVFVQPQQVADIVARHRQILKARLVVSGSVGNDQMSLHCEVAQPLIDGETTLKRYLVDHGKPFLRAENADYPDLLPARELIIQGVLVALLRHAA